MKKLILGIMISLLPISADASNFRWDLGFTQLGGNSDAQAFNTKIRMKSGRKGYGSIGVKFNANAAKVSGNRTAENYKAILHWDTEVKYLDPILDHWYGEFEWYKNRFKGLDHQESIELGAGKHVLIDPWSYIRFRIGMNGVREERLPNEVNRYGMASAEAEYHLQVNHFTHLMLKLKRDHNFSDDDDYRWFTHIEMENKLTKYTGLTVSHELERRHKPVAGFTKSDRRFMIGVRVRI